MTEATGGRRLYNREMGAGRCGNIAQPAKQTYGVISHKPATFVFILDLFIDDVSSCDSTVYGVK